MNNTAKTNIAAILLCGLLSGAVGSGVTAYAMSKYQTEEIAVPVYTESANNTFDEISQSALSYDIINLAADKRTPLTVSETAAKVSPAVVSITASVTITDRFGRVSTSSGSGSGIIFSEDGYILTNNHVVEGADTVIVKLATGAEYPAKIVGTDSITDLAVLKLDGKSLPYAVFGDSDKLITGDLAVAIGNPLGEFSGTVTSGIISATDREITIDGEKMNLLQTDAAINPGNSGGALVNAYGEVIGVVNAKESALGIEGLGFAIPINDAKPVIEQLIKNGYVTGRPGMGVSYIDITAATARFYRMEAGLYINSVTAG
ncbi:hypothetical protein FACS1894105_11250 [Clostridia bacterium]|nr:hypothetical protein FACS1894105_11250 [Clostridia bacterium]